MNNNTLLLAFVGLAVVGVGVYMMIGRQQVTSPAPQQPYYPVSTTPTSTTPTNPDNTARDWELGVKTGTAVVESILGIVESFS